MKSKFLFLLPFLLFSLIFTTLGQSNPTFLSAGKYPASAQKGKPSKSDANGKTAAPTKTDEEKPFADLVKDMQVTKGLFTFYRKTDENKVYMEILPAQLNTVFLFSGSIDQSVGERGL